MEQNKQLKKLKNYTEIKHKSTCKSLRIPYSQLISTATGHTWVYRCDCGLDELLKRGGVMSLDKKLMKEFEQKTGKIPTYKRESSTYHTLVYVDWLESRIKELEEENKRLKAMLIEAKEEIIEQTVGIGAFNPIAEKIHELARLERFVNKKMGN